MGEHRGCDWSTRPGQHIMGLRKNRASLNEKGPCGALSQLMEYRRAPTYYHRAGGRCRAREGPLGGRWVLVSFSWALGLAAGGVLVLVGVVRLCARCLVWLPGACGLVLRRSGWGVALGWLAGFWAVLGALRAGLCGGRLCWCFACGVWLLLLLALAAGLVRAGLGVAAGAGALARFLSVRAFLPALCVCVLLAVLGARRAACCCRCGARVLWFGAGVVCVGGGAGVGCGLVSAAVACLAGWGWRACLLVLVSWFCLFVRWVVAAAWGVFGAFFCSVRFGFVAPPALEVAYRLVLAVGAVITL